MKVEKIAGSRRAVHCITREQCYVLLQLLEKQNFKWTTGEKATARVPFAIYKEDTGIAIWDGQIWSENVDWYKKHNYEIIECSEIEDLPEVNLFSII